ncbi:MAG: EAL domain-containing protein [Sulfurimonas sp.]|nr:EAL domain-containing protein [Sulfurimonas sp.]
MQSLYFGCQPVISMGGVLDSYEFLYTQKEHSTQENYFIFATVFSDVLGKFGTKAVLGEHKAFVKVDEKLLFSEKIFTIQNEFFILSLVDEVEINENVIKRLEQLNTNGYLLAIDNFSPDSDSIQNYEKLLDKISFVKINIEDSFVVSQEKKKIVDSIKEKDITVVGTNILDKFNYELSKNLGCELFQGYYFSKAKVFEDKEYKAPRLDLLKLYSLLVENAELEDITAEFKKNNEIAVMLLKYINSGAFHFKNRISSMHHILTLVGREPLVKWLMLVIYSLPKSSSAKISPLMLMIKNRTELMERILKEVIPDAGKSMLDQAYFVGVLSLIDAVFEENLEKILDEMNVYDVVRNALLRDSDILGEIYALVRDIEAFKPDAVIDFEEKHDLSNGVINKIIIECMQEVTAFEMAIASIEG